ncbi:hypothetical protein Leryth_019611 [Lithospermum erythrorhizon]|nr:hypothetical protein Leryth_019611 [Lithospermum erythrorhizon]
MKRLKADGGPSNQVDCDTLADSPNTVIKSEDLEWFVCWQLYTRRPDELFVRMPDSSKEEGAKERRIVVIRVLKTIALRGVTTWALPMLLTTSRCNETSASECNQALVSSGPDDRSRDLCTVKNGDDLMEIFTSIAQNELGTVFRHRLDSQKRARYKKMIKQHLDFGTLRSRLVDGSIKSVKELFWDLFLLANNALVFYSKRTREYKSAFSLRGIVKKAYRQHCENSYNKATSRFLSLSQCCRYAFLSNPPSKPRSARPCPHPRPCIDEPSLKFQCTNETGETPGENEKLVDSIPLRYLLVAKKSLKHGANVKGASSRNSR